MSEPRWPLSPRAARVFYGVADAWLPDDDMGAAVDLVAALGPQMRSTRERVRQLEARVVARLREFMKENLVDFEYYAPGKD